MTVVSLDRMALDTCRGGHAEGGVPCECSAVYFTVAEDCSGSVNVGSGLDASGGIDDAICCDGKFWEGSVASV